MGLFISVATPPVAPVEAPVGTKIISPVNPGHGSGMRVIARAPLTVVINALGAGIKPAAEGTIIGSSIGNVSGVPGD